MTVISLSITESSQELVSGIPSTITISANIPCTIFYTLDDSEPTTDSSVYVGPISLPTTAPSVILKIFATNGTDSSDIISQTYSPIEAFSPKHRDSVIGNLVSGPVAVDQFPFGGPTNPPITYGRPAGITVDAPDIPNFPDGYDGAGGPAAGTDQPLSSYQFIYSDRDSQGNTGKDVGNLPGHISIRIPDPIDPSNSPSSYSKTSDRMFNPKALVIYQDSREDEPEGNNMLNRRLFSLGNSERESGGSDFSNRAFDSSTVTGSFLRSHYNPKDNTITYYYRDSNTNRWIISVEPFVARNDNLFAYDKIIFNSRTAGNQFVYKWLPFASRRLI